MHDPNENDSNSNDNQEETDSLTDYETGIQEIVTESMGDTTCSLFSGSPF